MKKFVLISALLSIIIGIIIYQSPALQHKITSVLPESVNHQLEAISPDTVLNKTAALYKWKDKKGQWIVSDTPPSDGTPYETLRYNRNTNVIPSKITNK